MPELGEAHGAAVKLRDVLKVYGDSPPAVDRVSLDVLPGEFLTLLGPSGSGKTTTLNAIAGFTEVDSGIIELDGVDLVGVPPYKRGIGMVFQQFSLFPHMSVAENVAYPLRQRKVPRQERETRVRAALELVRLGDYGRRRSSELSGGQQQRVAVARAIVFEPRVLLMDEPFGALDRNLREELQVELRGLHRKLGMTIIFVTHDQEEALVLSDRIAVFNNGSIQQIDSPYELYHRPTSTFVAGFLGESNILPGVLNSGAGDCSVSTRVGTFTLPCKSSLPNGEKVSLVVRPEHVHVAPVAATSAGENTVEGVLEELIFLGSGRKYLIRSESGERLIGTAPGSTGPDLAVDEPVRVSWSGSNMYVLAEERNVAT